MLDRIKTHNFLNGHLFSLIEFLVFALIVGPFVGYYFLHSQVMLGLAGFGVLLNFLVVVCMAGASLIRREASVGFISVWRDAAIRRKIEVEYPKLSQDSVKLAFALMIPYAVLAFVAGERVARKLQSGRS